MSKVVIELTREQADILKSYVDNKIEDIEMNLQYEDYHGDLELKEEWESDIKALREVYRQI